MHQLLTNWFADTSVRSREGEGQGYKDNTSEWVGLGFKGH
jgi:hypothetical protein